MRDGTENVAQLELLRAQRAALASRLKTPWWYVAGSLAVMAVAFSMPLGSHYLIGGGLWCALLAIVASLLLQYALARASGVDVGMRIWQYPSGRAWTIAMVVLILAASGVETVLLEHHRLAVAIAVGALATLVGTACWQGHVRSIRRDLASGRAAL
jgi:hypothetical protein